MRTLIIILVCLFCEVYMASLGGQDLLKENYGEEIELRPNHNSIQDLKTDETMGIGFFPFYKPYWGGYRGFYMNPFYHYGNYPYYGYGYPYSRPWHYW